MFKITDNKGFHLTFDNGLTLSCQIGSYNYCDNRVADVHEAFEEMKHHTVKCKNCEVAIFDKADNFITSKVFKKLGLDKEFKPCDNGIVVGYVDVNAVAKIITYLSENSIESVIE